jgi:hypothetical protein
MHYTIYLFALCERRRKGVGGYAYWRHTERLVTEEIENAQGCIALENEKAAAQNDATIDSVKLLAF